LCTGLTVLLIEFKFQFHCLMRLLIDTIGTIGIRSHKLLLILGVFARNGQKILLCNYNIRISIFFFKCDTFLGNKK
jgi:hypothetical protein